MFKAFTDNLSSFIGEAKPADQSAAVAAEKKDDDSKTAIDESQQSGDKEHKSEDGGATDTKDDIQTSSDGQEAADSQRKISKVPPPRPNPPLTPSSSLCRPDTPTEVESSVETASGETPSQADGEKKDRIDEKLEEVTQKAREWGSKFPFVKFCIFNFSIYISVAIKRDNKICELPYLI